MNELTNALLSLLFSCCQISRFGIYAAQNVLLLPDKFEIWDNYSQSYGELVMSKIASEKGVVPVWKSIEEHLKDIDLYVTAIENVFPDLHSWYDFNVTSGARGVLMVNDTLMYTNYTSNGDIAAICAIPKFVYRIIRAHCLYCHEFHHYNSEDHDQYHYAVIIVHNDPTEVSDADRFDCESCSGWDEIENTYTEAGLTYVCHLNEEMSKMLGKEDDYDPKSAPLNLDSMDYTYSENWDWTSLTCPREAGDQRGTIYEEYLKLKSSVLEVSTTGSFDYQRKKMTEKKKSEENLNSEKLTEVPPVNRPKKNKDVQSIKNEGNFNFSSNV